MVTEHVDAETLALFAEGKLSRAELPPVLEHVTKCASCMRIVKIAGAQAPVEASPEISVEAPRRISPYWLATAAAAIVVLVAIPAVRRLRATPEERLAQLAPRSARIVEPRIAGGLPWAPWRGSARAGDLSADAARLKIAGLAGELMERADARKTPDAQHAAGAALLLAERPLDALPRLRDAADHAPDQPRVWSDLAAAYYAAATSTARASLYPEALAAADRALRIDGQFPEALFNRALVLERMGAKDAARAAWERYLRADAASSWATEAREHLRRVSSATGAMQFQRDLSLLERAAIEGDHTRVAALVAKHPQLSRLYAEGEFLGKWAEAEPRDAARSLTVARAVGAALEQRTGEALLAGAVRAIDGANSQQKQALAEAHTAYRRGRIAYSRQRPADAEADLRHAAMLFAGADSPMSYLARYFAACTRYDQNDLPAARSELTSLLAGADEHPRWIALGAQVRWQLSLCFMNDDDWSGALPLLRAAEASFDRLGERNHLGFLRSLLADALACVGRPDESWNVRIQSFALQSAEGLPDHYMGTSFGSAARTALRAGRLDAARSLIDLEIETDRTLKHDVLLTNALARATVLSAALGDDASASRMSAEATAVARRIGDAALRTRALDNAAFASGAALLRANPRGARGELTRAIDGYRRSERTFYLPESYLLRARAGRALGDLAAATDDLERGIAELERHRIRYSGTVIGTGVFDAGRSLFHDAIRVLLQRGDAAGALAYAERSRPRIGSAAPMTVAGLQARLRDSGTCVLEIVALPDEVIVFCVTGSLQVARSPIGQQALAELAARSVRGDRDALSRLHSMLVRPVEGAIASSERLIVVADPTLDAVPFGGLYDVRSGHCLIERMPVALSLSALALESGQPAQTHRSLVTVSLPEGERGGSTGLPHVRDELDDVRRLYAQSVERRTFAELAAARSDVLHIAGHTQARTGSDEPMLGFAAPHGDGREWMSWRRIARERFLSGTTVVLAACDTLRRPESSQTFALSLGGGFLAAGAGDVIGTLDAIGDRDAQRVFQAVHRELAAGADPAEAVRRAQLDALSRYPSNHTAWFAVSVLTNRIRNSEQVGGP